MLIPFDKIVKKYDMNITGVIHVGAHLGEESEAYQAAGVKKVIWVEADPNTRSRLLSDNRIPETDYTYCEVISDLDDDVVTFHEANNGQSSSILNLGTHAKHHPEVMYVGEHTRTTTKLDTLMSRHRRNENDNTVYNFLNLDIQGAEGKALIGASYTLANVDYVYTEVNDEAVYEGCILLPYLDDLMASYGFGRKETEMTPFHWGDSLYVKVNK